MKDPSRCSSSPSDSAVSSTTPSSSVDARSVSAWRLGSTHAGIVCIVSLDVFLMIALGGCAGVALGFGATRYVESLFYQVKATDADIIALLRCAILLTALVATLPAVLRALRTDPTEIMRTE